MADVVDNWSTLAPGEFVDHYLRGELQHENVEIRSSDDWRVIVVDEYGHGPFPIHNDEAHKLRRRPRA